MSTTSTLPSHRKAPPNTSKDSQIQIQIHNSPTLSPGKASPKSLSPHYSNPFTSANRLQSTPASELLLIFACFLLSTGSSVGIIVVNKYIYEKLYFTLETTLMAIHQLSTALMCQILIRIDPDVFQRRNIPWKDALKVSFLYTLSIVFVNLSLFYSTVGTFQISKLLVAPMILILNFVLYGQVVKLRILLAISVLLLGVFAVELSDVNWKHWRGALYSLLGIVFTAYSQVVISSKHQELKASSFQLLYYQAPISGVLLLLCAPFVEGWSWEYNILTVHLSTKLMLVIALSCVIAFGTTFGTFLVIGQTSPLTYQVLGHVKTVLVILLGMIMFENVPNVNTNIRYIGFVLSAAGAILYTVMKIKETPPAKHTFSLLNTTHTRNL